MLGWPKAVFLKYSNSNQRCHAKPIWMTAGKEKPPLVLNRGGQDASEEIAAFIRQHKPIVRVRMEADIATN